MKDGRTPAQRLTLARIAAGYEDQVEFYRAFNIPQGTYTQHESGQRGIRPKVAEKYAGYLGNCSAAWILYGEGEPPATDHAPVGVRSLPPAEAETTNRRYQETAAFLLLYDRLTILTEENEKATTEEFSVVFRHFGYMSGPRGVAQLAFRLWRDVVEEDNTLSLPERALRKIEWVESVLQQMVNLFREIRQPPPPKPPEA